MVNMEVSIERQAWVLTIYKTIQLEISGINIKHLNATLWERESKKSLSTSARET